MVANNEFVVQLDVGKTHVRLSRLANKLAFYLHEL